MARSAHIDAAAVEWWSDDQIGPVNSVRLLGRVSGLCQPAYVLDIPGGFGKSPIGPGYLEPAPKGWIVEDFRGGRHAYDEAAGAPLPSS